MVSLLSLFAHFINYSGIAEMDRYSTSPPPPSQLLFLGKQKQKQRQSPSLHPQDQKGKGKGKERQRDASSTSHLVSIPSSIKKSLYRMQNNFRGDEKSQRILANLLEDSTSPEVLQQADEEANAGLKQKKLGVKRRAPGSLVVASSIHFFTIFIVLK